MSTIYMIYCNKANINNIVDYCCASSKSICPG
jgi:hypothetical protein